MAKCGNHGRVVPRDRDLLSRLYWVDGLTLPDLGERFGVTHKSMERVFRELDIPRRGKGVPPTQGMCIDCGIVRIKKVPHKLTKNGTGTRCHECLKHYKRMWQKKKAERSPEEWRAKRKAFMERWYREGPLNPKGEEQWIRKSKHLLRTNRRLLAEMTNPARSPSRSAAFAPAPISQT